MKRIILTYHTEQIFKIEDFTVDLLCLTIQQRANDFEWLSAKIDKTIVTETTISFILDRSISEREVEILFDQISKQLTSKYGNYEYELTVDDDSKIEKTPRSYSETEIAIRDKFREYLADAFNICFPPSK